MGQTSDRGDASYGGGGLRQRQIAAGALRSWADLWEPFRERHAAWLDRVGGRRPVYTLPQEAVGALARGVLNEDKAHRHIRPLIGDEDAEAERDIRDTCRSFSATTVGVWEGGPVDYAPLAASEPTSGPTDQEMEAMGWARHVSPEKARASLAEAEGRRGDISHQVLGYAGRLTFDGQYRGELAALKARWEGLSRPPQMPFTAGVATRPPTPVISPKAQDADVLPDDVAVFLTDLDGFLRKWQVARLVTWDLPEHRGPLAHVPLCLAAALLGPAQSVSTVPSYYDIPSHRDVRGVIGVNYFSRPTGVVARNWMRP